LRPHWRARPFGLRREGRTVTVWFYELALGSFIYGLDTSVKPLPVIEAKASDPATA
jgi:hypothetical protein